MLEHEPCDGEPLDVSPFRFAALTSALEAKLASRLALAPLALPEPLAHREGAARGQAIAISTRAYRGPRVHYARFVRMTGGAVEIGNVLCLPAPGTGLPIFGGDFVALSAGAALVAIDLSPLDRAASIRPLADRAANAARRGAWTALTPAGALPSWCARFFSPHALFARLGRDGRDAAADAAHAFADAFIELATGAAASAPPASEAAERAHQRAYARAHREEDRGLRMLHAAFGAEWTDAYLARILFPDEPEAAVERTAP